MKLTRGMHWAAALAAGLITTATVNARQWSSLPPIDHILDHVLDRAQLEARNEHHFKQLYAYNMIRVKDEFHANGHLRKRDQRNRAHEPDPNAQIPLEFDPARSADPDADPRDLNEAQAAAAMQQGRAFNKEDFPLTRDLLDRFAFTVVGRDSTGDRPALILDFWPADRKLPVREFKDRFINRAAGRVWIDEEDWAVTRAELRLTEPVHVVGGLVGTVRRFRYELVRDRTPEGLWYPTTIYWRLEGRQFLARKVIESNEQMQDLRRAR